jgi:hypothetical protein
VLRKVFKPISQRSSPLWLIQTQESNVKHGAAAVLLAALSVACGQSNTLSGKVDNKTFEPADATYVTVSDPNQPSVQEAVLAITSTSGTCDDFKAFKQHKNASVLFINLRTVEANGVADLKKGTYDVSSATQKITVAAVQVSDATCQNTVDAGKMIAGAGTVTISSYSKDSKVEGEYSLTFGGDTITGHFEAPFCTGGAGFAAQLGQGLQPQCI